MFIKKELEFLHKVSDKNWEPNLKYDGAMAWLGFFETRTRGYIRKNQRQIQSVWSRMRLLGVKVGVRWIFPEWVNNSFSKDAIGSGVVRFSVLPPQTVIPFKAYIYIYVYPKSLRALFFWGSQGRQEIVDLLILGLRFVYSTSAKRIISNLVKLISGSWWGLE